MDNHICLKRRDMKIKAFPLLSCYFFFSFPLCSTSHNVVNYQLCLKPMVKKWSDYCQIIMRIIGICLVQSFSLLVFQCWVVNSSGFVFCCATNTFPLLLMQLDAASQHLFAATGISVSYMCHSILQPAEGLCRSSNVFCPPFKNPLLYLMICAIVNLMLSRSRVTQKPRHCDVLQQMLGTM